MTKLFLLLLFVAFTSCDNSNNYSPPSYQETKMTLEQQENSSPTDFLSVEGTFRKNLIGEWVIEGNIVSKATIATYKDVTVKISYYSETKTEIGSEEKTILKYFKPNSSQPFKIKTNGVEGTNNIGLSIVSASSSN